MNNTKTVVVRYLAETGQFQASMLSAAQAVDTSAGQIANSGSKAASGVQTFAARAAAFGKVVTLGVAGGLALSAKAAIEFESSFAGIRKTLDATPSQFANLAQEIRNLSTEIPISVNQLNRIGELGGQLGVSVEGMTGFIDTIAKVSVSTSVGVEDAALSISRLASVMGVSEKQFNNIGSALIHLGNNTNTTESEILTFALRIAGPLKAVGAGADEVLAIAAAFSEVGIPAERGGTAVIRVIDDIGEAVAEGGEKLAAFADVANMEMGEFSDLFRRDAPRALEAFVLGLGEVIRSGGDVYATLDEVGLREQRVRQAFITMGSAAGKLTQDLNLAGQGFSELDALTEEAEKRFGTVESRIQLAKNQLNDLAIEMGNKVLPIIGDFADDMGTMFEVLKDNDDTVGNVVQVIGGLGVALFTVNTAAGIAKKIIPGVTTAIQALESSGRLAAATFTSWGVGAAFTLAAIAMGTWIKKHIEAKQRIEELTEALKESNGALDENIRTQIKDSLTDQIDLFNRVGISIETATDAVLGNEEAQERIRRKIEGSRGTLEGYVRTLLDGEDAGLRFSRSQDPTGGLVNSDKVLAARQALQDLLDVENLLFNSQSDLNKATQEYDEYLNNIIEQKNLEAQEKGFRNSAEMAYELARQQALVELTMRDVQEEVEPLVEDLEALSDAADDVYDAFHRSRSAAHNFRDALADYNKVIEDANEDGKVTVDELFNIESAFGDVQQAAKEVAEEDGWDTIVANIVEMFDQGVITKDQMELMLEEVAKMEEVAPRYDESGRRVAGVTQDIGAAAEDAEVDVQNLIGTLGTSEYRMTQFARKLEGILRDMGRGRNQIDNFLRERPTGEDRRGGGGQAFGSGSSLPVGPTSTLGLTGPGRLIPAGVGAGGSSSLTTTSISSAAPPVTTSLAALGSTLKEVNKELKDVKTNLEKMSEATDSVTGQVRAMRDLRDATRELRDLEKERRDLITEQQSFPGLIRRARREYKEAVRDAKAITLEEQLAIETAEENAKRAKLAYKQGIITLTEYKLALKAVKDAEKEATSTDVDTVRDAEEKLKDLLDRRKEVNERLKEIDLDILDAKLGLIDAQLRANEAMDKFRKMSKSALDLFRKIAEQAGLTKEQIEEIIKIATTGKLKQDPGKPPPNVGGQGSFTVAGGLGSLIDGVGSWAASMANTPATYAPNSDMAAFAAARSVTYANYDQSVTIGSLHIEGTWDLTDPYATARIVDNIENELASRQRARGVSFTR